MNMYNELIKLKDFFYTEILDNKMSNKKNTPHQNILIDGVIFQLQEKKSGGISVVWENYLRHISQSALANKVVVLDRCKTAPRIDGLKYINIKRYKGGSDDKRLKDALYLRTICQKENASLLISTYYTYADSMKTVIMIYDFVPERLCWDLDTSEWQSKKEAINEACAYITISTNTLKDFRFYYPQFSNRKVTTIYNAASEYFKLNDKKEINSFQKKYKIVKPYYLIVGHRWPHKNVKLFFEAVAQMSDLNEFEILIIGGNNFLEKEYLPYVEKIKYQVLSLPIKDLSVAYSGSLALVYPSLYEGFGLPILEAMQSGCPVITSPNSSLLEIGQDACLYVNETDINGMLNALITIRDSEKRNQMIKKGLVVSSKFSWAKSGDKLIDFIDTIDTEYGMSSL